MNLVLSIYTDDTLTEVKRVVEADELKIPYRVSVFLIQALDNIDIKNDSDLVRFISQNIDKLDKIIKATFNITENELECLNTGEVINVLKSLFKWGVGKVNSIKGNDSKN